MKPEQGLRHKVRVQKFTRLKRRRCVTLLFSLILKYGGAAGRLYSRSLCPPASPAIATESGIGLARGGEMDSGHEGSVKLASSAREVAAITGELSPFL